MGLETVTYISDLIPTNPDGADSRTTSDDHLRNIKKGLKNAFSGFVGGIIVTGTDGGAVNAYTVANSLPSLTDRVSVVFSPTVTNTAAATININGLGAKAIKRVDGSDLIAGELVAGSIYVATYNGTEFRLRGITKQYVDQLAFGTALPAQPGGSTEYRLRTVNGVTSWSAVTNEAKGADIPSAATVDLDSATGNFVHITGTTTITAITLSSGAERTVVFDGALTLTHNAASLILPGAANIATAAGDRAIFRGDGVGNVRCITYTRASGLAVVAPAGLTLLSTVTANNSATVDVDTTFSSTYDAYMLVVSGLRSATDGVGLCMQMKVGGAYDTGANYAFHVSLLASTGATYSADNSTGTTSINIASDIGNAASKSANLTMRIYHPASTAFTKRVDWTGNSVKLSGAVTLMNGVGSNTNTSALTGLRFFMQSGNIAVGTFRLYGIANS